MSKDDVVRRALAGGKVATGADLVALGLNRMAISRLVSREVLARRACGVYVLAEHWDGEPLPAIAARFGGAPSQPLGVVCLRAAAVVHGLTDMGWWNVPNPEVALPRAVRLGPVDQLPVRVVRLSMPHGIGDLVWREFGGRGIHVTTPERTVSDLYAPWSGDLPDGIAKEALARLMTSDRRIAARAVMHASALGWGRQIAADYEAMVALRRFTEAGDDDVSGMRGISL